MKCKNTIAMLLAGAMLLPANAFAADLSKYKDFPNDWSAKSLEQAVDDGLLNGSNGMIDAKGLLTRAQMAAIVSRAFGASKTTSLDDYRDVLPSAWYYSDMGKAVRMGAFQGSNGLLNPDAPITREEVFTVLARAFALEGGSSAALKDFVDGGAVSSWASESVAALVANGYVNGANGRLNLKNNITRAEFAKVITGMAASYVGAESVSGRTVEGNVIVRESGASLSGMTINGDLIIADSADKVSLDGVTVTGRIVIRGGAESVSMKDTRASKGVLVSCPNGAAAISVSGGSVGTVTAKSDLAVSGGSVDKVVLENGASLTVGKGASAGSVTVSGSGSKVSGEGTVTSVQANADNVTVSTKNTKVTAASGVSGVKAGGKTVAAGRTETVGSNGSSSSGGSSGGGSSSSSSVSYVYAYAAVPYDEYWKSEGVYLSGSDWKASSDETDYEYPYVSDKEKVLVSYDEKDKGAYDAVSRATARHGIHRGSYQQVITFHTQEGKELEVSHWIVEGKNTTLVLKDGTQAQFASTAPKTNDDPVATITMPDGTEYHMTGSTMTGIRYVPVMVREADFEDFCSKYEVTRNGETMSGGYTERMLLGYDDLIADVDANTEGLKTVTRNSDGSYSFSARSDGSDSGIKGVELKKVDASKIDITPQPYSGGTYGSMFRVHITNKNKADASSDDNVYGQLGSRMQSVTWKYYGYGDTVLATYGTKFAADIWMHGSNGIQLGLTNSLRAQLPEGTDGTGKWVGTIHALGYQDFTFEVTLTDENVNATVLDAMTEDQRTGLTQLRDAAKKLLDAREDKEYASVTSAQWKDLQEHYDEADALLTSSNPDKNAADELLSELPGMIAPVKLAPVTETYTALFPVLTNEEKGYKDYWDTSVKKYFEDNNKTVTEEQIAQYAEYLRTVCQGTKYGAEAEEAYKDSEDYQFNCTFINGVDTIKFDGNTISGTKDSTEVFSHTYTYEGEVTVGKGEMSFTGDLYKTSDANAGEFTYFIMRDDTPGTTQHIEFRYGSDLEQLKGYITGNYAYWLAAGIPVNSEDAFVKKCIDLFVSENLAGVNPSTPEPTVETKTATLAMLQDQSVVGSKDEYEGGEYDITVTVTLDNGKITNVSATSTASKKADKNYFASLAEESFYDKFKDILATDTSAIDNIDAVSEATYSSATVKQAVKNALKN